MEPNSNEHSRVDELGSDYGFVFPHIDKFYSPFFIKNPSFNGGISKWRLSGGMSIPSSSRYLSTRWFSH